MTKADGIALASRDALGVCSVSHHHRIVEPAIAINLYSTRKKLLGKQPDLSPLLENSSCGSIRFRLVDTCQYGCFRHWTPATNFDLDILICRAS